jgi:predicted CXXCH cytochrome family protein
VLVGVACVVSCTDTERHRALSFLFDGVPPLPGQVFEETQDEDAINAQRRRVEPTWFLHEPQSDCQRCHGDQKQENFSRQVKLVSPLPALCYECHDMPQGGKGWVHGPVASGQCVICHEPHRSLNRYLLKRPEPQMCFQCHEETSLKTLPGHDQASFQACLDCHAGHSSFAKHLLKAGSVVSNARQGRTEPTGDARFDAFVATAQADIQAGQTLPVALSSAVRRIESSELIQARAIVMAIRLGMSYSEQDRQRVLAVETAIEAAEKTDVVQRKADRRQRAEAMAQLYYDSVNRYRSGRLQEARTGFETLLVSDVVPATIKQAIKEYVVDIDQRLAQEGTHR